MPVVSAIIAAHNAEQTIVECLRSILAQDVDLEIVLCDDASTDETATRAAALGDRRVRILYNEVNLGAGPSRDRAIDAARGRWIALMDADDVWLPGRLCALLDAAGDNDRAIVFDDILDCHDSPNGLVPFRRVHGQFAFGEGKAPARVSIARYVTRRRLLAHPIISGRLVDESGARHGTRRSGQDLDFRFALLAGGGELFYVPRPYYLYRLSPGSLSSGARHAEAYLQLFSENRARYDWPADVVAAFRSKEASVRRMVERHKLARAIADRDLAGASAQAASHPLSALDLCANLLRHVPYHLSRWRHGTRSRPRNSQ